MKDKKKGNQYTGLKRPNVTLTAEEHKEIMHFCIDQEMKIGEFLKLAGLYCVREGIDLNKYFN